MRAPIIAASVAVAGAVALGAWWWRGDAVDVYTATRRDLVQSIVATGQVTTPRRASIGAEVTARAEAVLVEEGATVRRGQPLIQLDDTDEKAALAQAQAAVAQAEARIRQIATVALPAAQESLRQARANLVQTRATYERTRDLVGRNFVSKAQLDDVERNLAVAESQVRAAEVSVATMSPGGGDFMVAQAALREATAAVGVAQARLDATTIRAPADGVLVARNIEPGGIAQAGKELLALAPAGETQIVVNVDEKNLGKLALGQRALVSADAYPDQPFRAELSYINPGVDSVRGTVEVKLRVPDPPRHLVQDMSVSVDIEVGRRSDAIVVPSNAVRDLGTARPWVLAVRNGHAVHVPVVVGMRGDTLTEIAQGLAVGEEIVPATNPRVVPGERVRTQPMPGPAT
ncbi:MAG: efflux RND transporter periplasmic adaptor subunit [Burkholderiales bacterium]